MRLERFALLLWPGFFILEVLPVVGVDGGESKQVFWPCQPRSMADAVLDCRSYGFADACADNGAAAALA